jgi:DNA-binding transcriptional LysR family regulator
MSAITASWDDQQAFLAVLESGSLSAAARRLSLSQPTVRHRIESLEKALGQPLFTRGVNGLTPTDEARLLADYVRRMAFASDAFCRAVGSDSGALSGTVRLSVAEFVGIEVIPPMLVPLRERHPGLEIELVLSNVMADVLHQEADIAVRMHPPEQDALVCQHAGRIAMGFFASPTYIETHGLPSRLEELRDHALIGSDKTPADRQWMAGLAEQIGGRVRFAFRTDSHPAQLAAVRAGLGIGIVQVPVGARGLIRVLPDVILQQLDAWIVAHEDLRRSPRIDAVFRHLVTAFRSYCA